MAPVAELFFSTVQNDTTSDVSGSRFLTQEELQLCDPMQLPGLRASVIVTRMSQKRQPRSSTVCTTSIRYRYAHARLPREARHPIAFP